MSSTYRLYPLTSWVCGRSDFAVVRGHLYRRRRDDPLVEVAEGERDSRRSLEGLQAVPEELVLEYPLVRNIQHVPLCLVSNPTLL